MKTPSLSKHIVYFDSIRGIAALTVVWAHFQGRYGNPLSSFTENTIFALLYDGNVAVSIFFVLSGFVLSAKYFNFPLADPRCTPNIRSFYIRRFCRISLPYGGVLLLSILVNRTLFQPLDTNPTVIPFWADLWLNSNEIGFWQVFREWFMLIGKVEYFFMPQAWTLRVELIFSFYMPFLILLAQRRTAWLIIFTLLIMRFTNIELYIVHFVLGILVAQHYSLLITKVKDSAFIVKLGLWMATTVLLTSAQPILPFLPEVNRDSEWLLTGLGSALLLVLVSANTAAIKLLSIRPLVYLGKVSYSVYLCHFIVILGVLPWLMLAINRIEMSDTLYLGIAFSLATALTIVLADLCYRFLEVPSINIGRFLVNKLERR